MKDYFLGLDMGTNSVGWAVTDTQYHILRAKGKDLWGIREFDEAETSAQRRTNRISRRRLERTKARIGILKEYFSDEIEKVDSNFFERLDNSKYYLEDKDENVRYKDSIFHDVDFTDKDYYKKYPTIFHLRKELIDNPEFHDVRLVYLAILNMFKHRGHFLNAGISTSEDGLGFEDAYYIFIAELEEKFELAIPSEVSAKEVEDILASKKISRSKKSEQLIELMSIDKKTDEGKRLYAFIKLLCGLSVDIKSLFEAENLCLEEDKKYSVCYSDFNYEEKISEVLSVLSSGAGELIEAGKKVYDASLLSGIMKGYKYLSEARVAEYEKHGKDLKILKSVMKKYASPDEYNKMFREPADNSYSAYVNSTNSTENTSSNDGLTRRNMKGRKKDDFYKSVKKIVNQFKDENVSDSEIDYILNEIECDTFLPKQLTSANGVIPNQAHARELKMILDNAEKYLPFLCEIDESGLSVSDRILQLFTFTIPYYIGPTNKNSKTGWAVRKEEGKIYPWNYKDKIDIAKTNINFIERMIRTCSYIKEEKVLPKNSLLYEKYCVLNEINNIRVNGNKIDVSLKQDIYRDLFETGKKVTKNKLCNYLVRRGIISEENEVSGIDNTINSSLTNYGRFYAIFEDRLKEDSCKSMVEDIIYLSTIYGDSKNYLKEQILAKYEVSENEIKRILGFKFMDWGRLSKSFLELKAMDKTSGEMVSIIQALWESNLNLMELIHSENYTFSEQLEQMRQTAMDSLNDFSFEDLDDYYFSAPVKRMIWQTILIIRELEKVLGKPPKRIFLEMTRKDELVKKRTDSRKKKFLELYSKIKDEDVDWAKIIEDSEKNSSLRSKKMYLYLTQQGKCMYTGENIDLDDLFNNNLYDIDHIYPRHFVKDDNLENNLVLVSKQKNARKSDIYPIEKGIFDRCRGLWKSLREGGFISEEKYKRLTCRNSFTEEQLAGFIARQIVETSQGTKGVADIIKGIIPAEQTTIVYSKASNVSEFRNNYERLKTRTVNDFHHAHDAYLNIVVGNTYYIKFTNNPMNFIKKEYRNNKQKYEYNLGKMFEKTVERNGEIAWVCSNDNSNGTISTVKEMLNKGTPLLTRKNFVEHGAISDATIYGKKDAKNGVYIPVKSSDPRLRNVEKYGGLNKASVAYFFLVEHVEKKKIVRTLETVPVYMSDRIEKNPEELEKYCENVLNLKDYSIKIRKIKMQSLIRIDGYYMNISGKTGNQIVVKNAVNMIVDWKWYNYIHAIDKYVENGNLSLEITKEKNEELYRLICKKHQQSIYAKKPNYMGNALERGYEILCSKSIEEQCRIIEEVLKLTLIGNTGANLSDIGGASKSGVMLISKTIKCEKEFKLIHQSVTGLFEKEVDLLNV